MARRLVLAAVLALAGLVVVALADTPVWMLGRPFHRVAVPAVITSNSVEVLGHPGHLLRMCTPRWHYVFEGRGYDGSTVAHDGVHLGPDLRRVGELSPGDTLTVWIDPERPQSSFWREDRPLGNDPGQWLLGAALLVASLVVAIGAPVRWRRAKGASA